ncbi:MAG TPA: formylglycine-generating enzyme family protein [Candidatus Limnocylindrales bacterium]|nr:formylglycine-generating enzyme family protein [Candidatus Limnocylindrales bacterium]
MRTATLFMWVLLLAGTASAQPEGREAPTIPDSLNVNADWTPVERVIDDMPMVFVPAGCFRMGTSDAEAEAARALDAPGWAASAMSREQAQHEVCLSEGFWIGQTEVTNAEFDAFVQAGGYTMPELWSDAGAGWLSRQNLERLPIDCAENAQPDEPRVCVTWYEAEAYVRWRGGALPTEAQWEFAARGPDSLIYPWGNDWNPELANVVDSDGLTPVGSYPEGASWVGALDMAGNAMEWVQDWLSSGYDAEAVTDPAGASRGQMKVEKGGWWGSNPLVARSAYRHFEDPPTYQDHHIGFRIVVPAAAAG